MELSQTGLLTALANAKFPENTSRLHLAEASANLSEALAPTQTRLGRTTIDNALSGATVTRKVNNDGFNIQIQRDNGETLKTWKSRTSGLAETLKTASQGEITIDATSKGGRIVASIQTPSNDGGLFSKPAHAPITQGLFSNVA